MCGRLSPGYQRSATALWQQDEEEEEKQQEEEEEEGKRRRGCGGLPLPHRHIILTC